MELTGLDFETYSNIDLRTEGVVNYVEGEHFQVLMAGISRVSDTVEDGIEAMVIDFTEGYDESIEALQEVLNGSFIVAHNAGFEYQVLKKLGIDLPITQFIDSAVMASTAGLGRSLEAAAPQALAIDKLPSGKEGIQLFCIPGTYQMENGDDAWDSRVKDDNPEKWEEFKEYCALDAALSLQLAKKLAITLGDNEMIFNAVTMQMNDVGWTVDMPLVVEMQQRYLDNTKREVDAFRERNGAGELNLNSHPQLLAWCEERGIKAKSFDEQHVEKMIARITKRLDSDLAPEVAKGYREVLDLLRTKQAMGGSSLKKLSTLISLAHIDDRGRATLHDSYLHAGAGATLRTSARGVQMQNLRRLGSNPDDVAELFDPAVHWSNDRLSHNLRQVFISSHELGQLIVGDYKSVESRGLAWYSGEDWKLRAYRDNRDVYAEQAAEFEGKTVDQVTPQDRQFGKLGELSCGYMAGAEAVQDFAEKMHMNITFGEAQQVVSNFRNLNARTVEFWNHLQTALEESLEMGLAHVAIPHGTITFSAAPVVNSLKNQTGGAGMSTLVIQVKVPQKNDPFEFTRIFHGVHRNGKDINYWKPSPRKTGDLWTPDYMDPKTKKRRKHSLYGGKLAGVLTQSLCREVFMDGMTSFSMWTVPFSNVNLVGQFHDEMVVDWTPPTSPIHPELDQTVATLTKVMSTTDLPEFPLACEVKHAYRYTK